MQSPSQRNERRRALLAIHGRSRTRRSVAMRYLKTLAFAASTVLVLGLGGISPASAQRGMHGGGFHGGGFHAGSFRGGWHGGGWRGRGWGWGPAVAGGLAFGALATAPYWGGYAY